MKCPEVRRHLFLFLDNELKVKENLEILTHLDLCPQCSEYFESEKQLEDFLKEKLTPQLDPNPLWEKVKNQLHETPLPVQKPRFMKRFFFWGPALAASFLVAFAIYHFSGPQKLNAETLVNQSVQIHRKVMDGDLPSQIPIDIRHNFQKTRAFLSEKVNLNICDHNLAKLGYAHREGCLARCNIAPDRQMATIIYYKGPSRISHFIIRDPSVSFPTNSFRQIKGTNSHYHYFIVRPYKVIVFKNGRTLCLFVGSMSRRHVSELAEFAAREMAS